MNPFLKIILIIIPTMYISNFAITAFADNQKAEREYIEGKISDYEMELKNQIFMYQSMLLIPLIIIYGYAALKLLTC